MAGAEGGAETDVVTVPVTVVSAAGMLVESETGAGLIVAAEVGAGAEFSEEDTGLFGAFSCVWFCA